MNNLPSDPNDYNRRERQDVSWWSNRRGRGGNTSGNLKQNRRITLIDLLLLAVMTGVLVPWFLTMDRGIESGIYTVNYDSSNRTNDILVKLEISIDKDSSVSTDDSVGWSIYSDTGDLLHKDMDLPPMPGESRFFRFISDSQTPDRLEIHLGSENIDISLVK